MKTLTQQQIDSLFEFTKQHYVDYYDVQVELVDHLANDIEQMMSDNEHISFEQARDKAFKKFGITGFYDVVSSKMWQMEKEYYKLIFKHFLSLLTSKMIVAIVAVFVIFSYVLKHSKYNMYLFFGFIVLLMLITFILIFKNGNKLGRRIKNKEKVLMVEVVSASLGNSAGFISLFYNLLSFVFHNRTDALSSSLLANYSMLFGLLLVFAFIFLYLAVQKASIEMRNKYRKKYFTVSSS